MKRAELANYKVVEVSVSWEPDLNNVAFADSNFVGKTGSWEIQTWTYSRFFVFLDFDSVSYQHAQKVTTF